MTTYYWQNIDAILQDPNNWATQPPSPPPPVTPGPLDSAKIQISNGVTALIGSLTVQTAEFVGGIVNSEYDLSGSSQLGDAALTAGTVKVDPGATVVMTSQGTSSVSITATSESIALASTLTQMLGTNTANSLSVLGTYNLQKGSLTVKGAQLIGSYGQTPVLLGSLIQTGGTDTVQGTLTVNGLFAENGGTLHVTGSNYAFVGIPGKGQLTLNSGSIQFDTGGIVAGYDASSFGDGSVLINGGALTFAGNSGFGSIYAGDGNFGEFDMFGGQSTGAGTVYVGFNNAASGLGSTANGKFVLATLVNPPSGGTPAFQADRMILASNDSAITTPLATAKGELDIGSATRGFGTLSLTSPGDSLVDGDQGTGVVDIGFDTITTLTGNFVLGNQAGSQGTVEHTNGRVIVGGTLIIARQSSSANNRYHLDGKTIGNPNGNDTQLQTSGLIVGSQQGSFGQFDITGGTFKVTDPVVDVVGSSGKGVLIISGGTASFAGELTVGDNKFGDGTVTLGGSGDMIVAGPVEIGNDFGAKGVFNFNPATGDQGTLEGSDSARPSFDVGVGGQGTLNVQNGTLQLGGLTVGSQSGGQGEVDIGGSGFLIVDAPANAVIGSNGKGTVNQSAGNAQFNGKLVIGNHATGDGNVTLGGTGAMTVAAPVLIGNATNATGVFNFNIDPDSDHATIDGANGGRPSFNVGIGGTGTLNVMGGQMQLDDLSLGKQTGSSGTAAISSANARLTAASIEVGNVQLADLKGAFSGGSGTLSLDQNARASTDGALSLKDVVRMDENYDVSFDDGDGRIDIENGAGLTVGGHSASTANELRINSGGLLIGHGLIDSHLNGQVFVTTLSGTNPATGGAGQGYSPAKADDYSLTVNINSGGTLEANGGPLVVHGNVKIGSGTAQIDDNSTLELAGSFSEATVRFADSNPLQGTGTLILDRPQDFSGVISNIAVGDAIVLKQTSDANYNGVLSATIGKDEKGELRLFIQEGKDHSGIGNGWAFKDLDVTALGGKDLFIKISGATDLTHDYFAVTQSPDGQNTILTLKQGNPIDSAISGPQARQLGLNGGGIKVGIISNSFDVSGHGSAASDMDSGLLPPGARVLYGGEFPSGADRGSDEGRAMAQVVHAIAPNAAIVFYSAYADEDAKPMESMVTAIKALKDAGCQIIVDDIVANSLAEPPNGGIVSAEINQVFSDGITYVASAGNARQYVPSSTPVYGHKTSPKVLSVAAVNAVGTPVNGGYQPTQTEFFSSLGSTNLKPNLSGPDGEPTSLPLGNVFTNPAVPSDKETLNPFFGTSAAAPAVAAVAALMMQANPQLKHNPTLLYKLIENSTTAFGEPANAGGTGLIDADQAVQAALASRIKFFKAILNDSPSVTASSAAIPTVTSAALSQPSGNTETGSTIEVLVTLNEAVTVTGSPFLVMNTGGIAIYDPAASNPGSQSLVFEYVVAVNDQTSDLTVTAFNQNGGAIADGNSNAPDFSSLFNVATHLSVNSPLKVSLLSTEQGTEAAVGQTVHITVTLNEAVVVNVTGGNPTLLLSNNGTAQYDANASDPASGKLVFDYAVSPADLTPELVVLEAVLPDGTTVKDAAGNNADFSGTLYRSTGLQIGPAFVDNLSASHTGTLSSGQSTQLSLAMSQSVVIDISAGLPTLTLNNGAVATYDAKASDPSTGLLVFDYTAGSGDKIADLGIAAVDLHGAHIQDGHGVDVDFSYASLIPTGLSINSPFVVTSLLASTSKASTGDLVQLTVDMNETAFVDLVDDFAQPPTLLLNDGATAVYDASASDLSTGRIVFDYTIGLFDQTPNLQATGVNLANIPIVDASGFNADFTKALNVPTGVQIVSLAVSVAQALADHAVNPPISSVVVGDKAINVNSNLDQLQAMSGALSLVGFSDSGAPTLTISGSQYGSDRPVIDKIISPFNLQITLDGGSESIAAPTNRPIGGSGGQDVILGDGHHDQITFGYQSIDFAITGDSQGGVTLDGGGGQPTYKLDAVEFLKFTDQIIFIENADNANIARLYSAALGRSPDSGGLSGWEDIYTSNISADAKAGGVYQALAQTGDGFGSTIAGGFAQSAEFLAKYGALDDAGFVTQLYLNVLDRAPATPELDAWLSLIHDSGFTRDMVLVGFAESPENISKTAGWLITV